MREKAKFMMDEYKKFALKGNILDLAIAVIIGNAFSRITQSLVNNIIMPLLSLLIGEINFNDLKVVFRQATDTTQEVALGYGTFIQVVIEFLIISGSIFIVYHFLTRLREKEKPKLNNKRLLLKRLMKKRLLSY